MSKPNYKRYSNGITTQNFKSFGESGKLKSYGKYNVLFNENNLSYCWLFIASDFNQYLSIRGRCRFQLLSGNIKLNSVDFQSPFDGNIYSPICNALTTIAVGKNATNRCLNFEACVEYLTTLETIDTAEKQWLQCLLDIQEEFSDGHSWIAIRMETFDCDVSDALIQFNNFTTIFHGDLDFPYSRKLKFSITQKDVPSFIMSTEIEDCVEEIVEQLSTKPDLSVAIVGSKGSGKSSLMRTVINRFFAAGCTEVCVIDGDPGQSEFCPSGCLALTRVSQPLLGPAFTNQFAPHVTVLTQLFVANTSANDDPKLYCRSIERLYHHYRELSTDNRPLPPLVINTMGWPQGLGLTLLAFKLFLLNPTYVIQLKKGRKETALIDISLESLTTACANQCFLRLVPRHFTSRVYILESVVGIDQRPDLLMKPGDYRDLTMVAYLYHQTRNRPLIFPAQSLPLHYHSNPVTRLRARTHAFVNYLIPGMPDNGADTPLPIVSLKLMYTDMNEEHQILSMPEVFRAAWVGICCQMDAPRYKSVIPNNLYIKRTETKPLYCLGMGVVSHIRKEYREMDILTGVDDAILKGSWLIKGNVYLPDCILLNQEEVLSKSRFLTVPFVSPMLTVGVGKTSVNGRKSFPKIRRNKH